MIASLDQEGARALLQRPSLARVMAVLNGDGEETRVVGGAVRDALLGRPVREFDLATTALPAETRARSAAAGFKTIPTGIAHGTVTVVVAGEPFEVTTLRQDVETDGRHARVRFGRDFAADAARRDLTVNALSLDPSGQLHDTVGGVADLAAGRVRFIGAARQRLREDALRALRFFRFHAGYARGAIDSEGYDAAIRERHGLARLSRERVRGEFLKLLAADRAVGTVALMDEAGLLVALGLGVAERGRLARAAEAGSGDPVGRLAALLVRTVEDADRLREALRLSNGEHGRLRAHAGALAAFLSRPGPLNAASLRRLAAQHGAAALRDLASATDGESRPGLSEDARALLAAYASGEAAVPSFPLTGADLVARGVPPGPEIGRRLAAARRDWLEAGCPLSWSLAPP